eukprot:NODE_11058_length_1311_cov_3.066723.p1 GENE.NODE_11058_length_1311_cov_3.066723~~NODE_11058_length_1311_cov_3.066723.p1  ORF type:complete len:423 (+),score=69.44 NODE_11058_length_1311_cov_3.066723:138-1271(+)
MVCGFVLMAAYMLLFAYAALSCNDVDEDGVSCGTGGPLQLWLAVIGSVFGGIGMGIIWVSQGAHFSAVAEAVADAEKLPKKDVAAELAGNFAICFIGWEALARTLFSVIGLCKVNMILVFFIATGISAAFTTVFAATQGFRASGSSSIDGNDTSTSICDGFTSALALWANPHIWLLSFINFGYGFSHAWVEGYVNANFLSEALSIGSMSVGLFTAAISIVAAIAGKLYGLVPCSWQGAMLFFGSLCFLLIGVLSVVPFPNGKGAGGWGWGVCIFYILLGLGRGTVESTARALFADTFPVATSAPAFANMMIQTALAATVSYALQAMDMANLVIGLVMACAVATYPAFLLSRRLQKTAGEPAVVADYGSLGTAATNAA